mmetsp:Transcript_35417/g.60179  ORF Transcript_35417/g.60179 Transcript_35417/m.60179 type:complete len:346 (+) Transcript_35417:49-1086(+)
MHNLQLRHDLFGNCDCPVNIFVCVCHTHESCLIHGGCEVHAPLQHHSVPLSEFLSICLSCLLEVLNGSLNKVPTKHTSSIVSSDGKTSLLSGGDNSVYKLLGLSLQLFVNTILRQFLHGLNTSSHGEGVSRQSTSLVHRSSRSNHLHDLLLSSIGTYRESSSNDLTHSCHVWCDTEVLLSTTVGYTESSHNFVENADSSVLGTQVTDALKELFVGFDETRVSNNRLQDNGGNFILVLIKDCLDRVQVVVFGAKSGLGSTGGNSRTIRKTQSGNSRSCLDQEGISMSVVASLELDHLLATSVSTAETDHSHAGLSSRVGESHHFHRRDGVDDGLSEFVLKRAGGTE